MTVTDAAAAEPLVLVEELVKHYPLRATRRQRRDGTAPIVHAVDGLDLELNRGDAVALIGESGCGKSTVAKVLVGLVEPTAGRVRIAGHDVVAVSTKDLEARRRVQMVAQNPWSALNRSRTVEHIVGQPLRVHGLVTGRDALRARVVELLEMVGLPEDYLSRRPRHLSGGELQRVTVARALAAEPDLLVLDEPTASLDVSVKATLVNLLVDLREKLDLTYLLITHELDVARHLADRVAVMYLGEVVESGAAAQVFGDPQHPYTRALLAASPPELVIGRLHGEGLVGEVPSAVDVPSGCRFRTRCPLVVEACRTDAPALTEQADGRRVACLLINELSDTRVGEELPGRNQS